ncbi:unnamed protein product [Discula destructiva]
MSNLTLNTALAQRANRSAKNPAQEDSPMRNAAMTLTTPVDGRQQAPLREDEGEDIPVFAHTIPAIFVPLKQDLLAPIEPAKDRVEHLQRMQKSLNANETVVRDNLAWMFEREARRRVADAKKTHDFTQPYRPQTLDWNEAEQLIGSISAATVPGQSYHVRPERLKEWHERIGAQAPAYPSPHEQTTHDALFVAHNGSRDIEDYSVMHIKPIREKMNTSLERATRV